MKSFLWIIFSFLVSSAYGQSAEIVVTIDNIKEIKGRIQLGLYNPSNPFPVVDKEQNRYFAEIRDTQVIFVIKDIPNGEYALAIYQDLNEDGVCNKNFIGYPTEPFGFSNNVVPILSAPSFKRAKFLVEKEKSVKISLR